MRATKLTRILLSCTLTVRQTVAIAGRTLHYLKRYRIRIRGETKDSSSTVWLLQELFLLNEPALVNHV